MNNDLPPFEKTPYCFAVLKSALRELTKKSGIGLKQIKIHEGAGFPVCYQAFNKFVSTPKKKEISEGGKYWDWIAKNYPDVLRAAIIQKGGQLVGNPLTSELNNLINQAPYDDIMLERIQGRFLVYRKHFSEPEHVMVMVLNCGINDDKTRFSLLSSFSTAAKDVEEDMAYGSIIPHQDNKMISFYGALQKWNAGLTMSVKTINTPQGDAVSEAYGGVMVSAPNYLESPSYSKVYLVRTQEEIAPFVVSKDEIRASPKNSEIVRHLKL
jgi:hypothetical protein